MKITHVCYTFKVKALAQAKIWRSPVFWCVASGVLLLIFCAWLWWAEVYLSPKRVYWGMLGNSFRTSSVAKVTRQSAHQRTVKQRIQQQIGAHNRVKVTTTLNQQNSTIVTENVGTPRADYIRYKSIETSQKKPSGAAYDFSHILGKWAKQQRQPSRASRSVSAPAQPPLFYQELLGLTGGDVIPIADFTAQQQRDLLGKLHHETVFVPDMQHVKITHDGGQPLYHYTVQIEPVAYAGFEQLVARDLGSQALDDLNPNKFQGQPPIKLQLVVDARAHRLRRIVYPKSDTGSHTIHFSSYNINPHIKVPSASIPASQLRQRLRQL